MKSNRLPQFWTKGTIVLLTLCCFGIAWALVFTKLTLYDDEGSFLNWYYNFCHGSVPYDEIRGGYGPFFYLVYGWLFRSGLVPLGLDGLRIITVIGWTLTVLLCCWFTYRMTRSFVATVFVMAMEMWLFQGFAAEPGHPILLCTLLTAALAAVFLIQHPWHQMMWLGLIAGLLILTKINVGIFAFIGIVIALIWKTKGSPATWLFRITSLAAIMLPFVLMNHNIMKDIQSFGLPALLIMGSTLIPAAILLAAWYFSRPAVIYVGIVIIAFVVLLIFRPLQGDTRFIVYLIWNTLSIFVCCNIVLLYQSHEERTLLFRHIMYFLFALSACFGVIFMISTMHGTSLQALLNSAIFPRFRHSWIEHEFNYPFKPIYYIFPSSISLMFCLLYVYKMDSPHSDRWCRFISYTKVLLPGLLFILFFILTIVTVLKTGGAPGIRLKLIIWLKAFSSNQFDLYFDLGRSVIWLLLIPCCKEGQLTYNKQARIGLVFLSLFLPLQVYPVFGYQVIPAIFLMPILLAICMWDGIRELSGSRLVRIFEQRGHQVSMTLTLGMMISFLFVTANAWYIYIKNTPLNLPGAAFVRIFSPLEVAQTRWVALNLQRYAKTFISIPGLLRYYSLTGIAPPTLSNAEFKSHTPRISSERQQEIISALQGSKNAWYLYDKKALNFRERGRPFPPTLLKDYLSNAKKPVGKVGRFELGVLGTSFNPEMLVECARIIESSNDSVLVEVNLATSLKSSIRRAEVIQLPGRTIKAESKNVVSVTTEADIERWRITFFGNGLIRSHLDTSLLLLYTESPQRVISVPFMHTLTSIQKEEFTVHE